MSHPSGRGPATSSLHALQRRAARIGGRRRRTLHRPPAPDADSRRRLRRAGPCGRFHLRPHPRRLSAAPLGLLGARPPLRRRWRHLRAGWDEHVGRERSVHRADAGGGALQGLVRRSASAPTSTSGGTTGPEARRTPTRSPLGGGPDRSPSRTPCYPRRVRWRSRRGRRGWRAAREHPRRRPPLVRLVAELGGLCHGYVGRRRRLVGRRPCAGQYRFNFRDEAGGVYADQFFDHQRTWATPIPSSSGRA